MPARATITAARSLIMGVQFIPHTIAGFPLMVALMLGASPLCADYQLVDQCRISHTVSGGCSAQGSSLVGSSDGATSAVSVLSRNVLPYQDFPRQLPHVVEATLFRDFEGLFNVTQDFHANGQNSYLARGRQVVVSIGNSRVTGVLGRVYDSRGYGLPEFADLESPPGEQLDFGQCKHFTKLATVVQKYGQMYYHFMQEVLPRVVLLLPYLGPDTKLLTFGSPHEFQWLAQLGVLPDQIEMYDPAQEYCADQLLVPTLSPLLTPPKENYDLVRQALHAEPSLPSAERNLAIYCTRRGAADRQVANEELLLAAVRQRLPSEVELRVFRGDETVLETLQLFRRAKIVLGMHGAGLSHIIFSAPDTAVIEFLFMSDPPMMFWHASAALGLRYIMVPLPQSWWLEQQVNVPAQDVLDALALALESGSGACQSGYFLYEDTGECLACPAGTYRPIGSDNCPACAAGRVARHEGSGFCSTCPAGFYSDSGFECTACPQGTTTILPGASSGSSCVLVGNVDTILDSMFDEKVLLDKLVSLPAMDSSKSSFASPFSLFRLYHRRQLRQRYLKELFHERNEPSKDKLAGVSSKRHLISYNYGSHSQVRARRSLYSYGGSRRVLYGYGRKLRVSAQQSLWDMVRFWAEPRPRKT